MTTPPIEAPRASIADQVALDRALAGINSRSEVTIGIVDVRAGSKNDVAELRDRLADVEKTEVAVLPEESEIGIHARL